MAEVSFVLFFFFFNDTATTEIYTLSLHDALPIYPPDGVPDDLLDVDVGAGRDLARDDDEPRVDQRLAGDAPVRVRSEEHTSELQSRQYLVCRLLLEKKKTQNCRSDNPYAAIRWFA